MNPPARLSAPDAGRWTLSGVLDFDTVARLAVEGETLLRTALAHGQTEILVDLAAIERANSAGLALLLEWLDCAQASGLRLTYTHLPESLQRLAALSNLGDVWLLADA